MNAIPKLKLQNVSKSFGTNRVLQGINLEIKSGESLVVIGGSGTGKSVMIKCILGIVRADSGSIHVDGKDITRPQESHREDTLRKFGMLFQGSALFDSLTIWENVAFGLIQGRGMARSEAHQIALDKMAQVGLGPNIADLRPAELSGGMQKRAGLARAIATEPEIIFFDEPTTGLDPIMADIINDLIVECTRTMGTTALTITHDLASARKIADKIAMLYQGQIIWIGPVSDIDDSGNPYVDQFINGRANGPIHMQVLKP